MEKKKEVIKESTDSDLMSVLEASALQRDGVDRVEQRFISNVNETQKVFKVISDFVNKNGVPNPNNKDAVESGKGRIFKSKSVDLKAYDNLVKRINGYGLKLEGISEKDLSAHISKEISYHNGALKQFGIMVKVRNSSINKNRCIALDVPFKGFESRFF